MLFGIYRLKDWFLLAPLGLTSVVLGTIGFENCAASQTNCHVHSLGEAFVRALLLFRPSQTFSFHRDPWELVIAQFLMFLLLLLAGLMGSIKLFVHNLRHDVHLARAQAMRGHVVVCGLGETGLAVVRGLRAAGGGVVAVTREESSDAVAACERMGVPILSGDASRSETLDHAGVARARAVVATTGSDALNLEISLAAGRRARGRATPLTVRPEIRAPWLIDAMARPDRAIFEPTLLVHPLRVPEEAARLLMSRGVFARACGPRPRLFMAGLGELGAAILSHAALSAFALPGMRAEIICYDEQAEKRQTELAAAPWRQFLDLEIHTARFGPSEDPARSADWEAIRKDLAERPPDAVLVALRDDNAALEAAFGLRDALDRHGRFATPIYVRTRRAGRLRQLLAGMAARPLCPDRLAGFGDLASLVAPEQLFDQPADRMARAVHAAYLAGQDRAGGVAGEPWERLAERFRRSSRAAADHLPVKLAYAGLRLAPAPGRAAGLREAEIELLAEAEHFRWSRVLLAEGWQQGGRDEAAKLHPLLRPWEKLPPQQRQANLADAAELPRIAEAAGLVIRRLVRMAPKAAAPGPDAIALLEIDFSDRKAWCDADALAKSRPVVIRARGLAGATLGDLAELEKNFPRAARSVEAWLDAPG